MTTSNGFLGGFRLSECGVDVSGRSVRFTENYRNTREVYQTASALLSGEIMAVALMTLASLRLPWQTDQVDGHYWLSRAASGYTIWRWSRP